MELSNFSYQSSLSASLLIVTQHPCSIPRLSEKPTTIMFQGQPACTRQHHIFFDFLFFLKTLSSSTLKRWFFLFFIICKFLMYKLKSDHIILVLSKHAQDMQNPLVTAPSGLSFPFLLVCFFPLEGAEYSLPGAPATYWQFFYTSYLCSIFLCSRKFL